MTDLVTIGWLTSDDIVLGDTVRRGMVGGGALYSAVGARIWSDSVGIHSVTGQQQLGRARADVAAYRIDCRGIRAIPGGGLQLWLLHETDRDKQQVPKLASATAAQMDAGRGPLPDFYADARGFHVAPQGPASALANVADLARRPHRPVVTMDLLADGYVDARLYQDLSFLDGLTAFLPSEAEIVRIWQPDDLRAWLCHQALAHGCLIAVKLGEQGSLLCLPDQRRLLHVPAFATTVADTTGAGDAFCGGFLAGLAAGRPPEICAAMGTVAASCVIEACGALATVRPAPAARDARLSAVLAGITATDL